MPPPTTSPAGSRTALITWSVVFAILFVTSAIFSIYFYSDSTKARKAEADLRRQYQEALPPNELTSDVMSQLRDLKQTPPEGSSINPGMSLFQVAVTQRDELAQLIGGPGMDTRAAAVARAQTAIQQAGQVGQQSNITVPATDNLANALTTMSNAVAARKKEVDALRGQLDQAMADNQAQAAQFEQQRQEMAKQLEVIRAEQQASIKLASDYQASKDQSIAQIEEGVAAERARQQEAVNQANVRIAELDRQLGQARQQLDILQQRLGLNRVDTQAPIVRHPDGRIIRLPSRDTVYIDLGAAQSVTPGLTFEVYDKYDGVPPAGDPATDENLPRGKASIEVVRVGPTSSEARVVRLSQGQQLSEGDLLVNLVFDPNVRYNFVVYGDFDMDRNGVATPQDADVIKRLITQWNGNIVDQVNVDTDFVILGKEPVVPSFSREELQDPFNAKKLEDAQAAANAYARVRDTAKQLHIPILNQNRFLYLIGYYEQARR